MIYKILFMFLCFFKQSFTETCTVNSLYNTTCPIGGLSVERVDININLNQENCDTVYKKEDFAVAPTVKFSAAKEGKLYSLLMADPDAVNIKPGTYVLHWLVANIEGSSLANGNLSDALTVKAYHPPSPPANSGIHRYQFTIYTQDQKLFGTVAHADRANFFLETWLETTNQNVCGPVAGLQFRVKAAINNSTMLQS